MTSRSRPEEVLIRSALPALSRAFPTALVMRNEANACMSLFRACQREVEAALSGDTHTIALVRGALNRAMGSTPDAIKYGLGVGSADVIVCIDGRFIALEFKSDGGSQSDEQVTWQGWVRRAGGVYAVVRSVGEAIDAVSTARPYAHR